MTYSRTTYSWSKTHRQSVGYRNVNPARIRFLLDWDWILIRLEPNSAMTHDPVLSVEVRRNGWLK